MDSGSAVDNFFNTLAQMILTGSSVSFPPTSGSA